MRDLDMLGAVSLGAGETLNVFEAFGLVPFTPEQRSTPASTAKKRSWVGGTAAAIGGGVGMLLWSLFPEEGKKHAVLGGLTGAALAGNAARVAIGEITPERAAENLGMHAVATASSLALGARGPWPYGLIGYLAGAAGSNLFLRRSLGNVFGFGDVRDVEWKSQDLGGGAKGRIYESTATPVPEEKKVPELVVKSVTTVGVEPISPTAVYTDPGTVKVVQAELANPWRATPDLKADGVIGPKTEAALRYFNASRDASQDGPYITDGVLAAMHVRAVGSPVPLRAPLAQAPSRYDASSWPGGDQAVERPESRPIWKAILAGIVALVAGGAILYGLGA
jgi:hypothetical protein